MIDHYSLLGVKISCVNRETVIALINKKLQKKRQLRIVTPNPEHIIQAQYDPRFMTVLNQADVAIPDGMGVVWGVKRKFKKQEARSKKQATRPKSADPRDTSFEKECDVERVTGVDLMVTLCRFAARQGWRVGLLGGSEESGRKTAKELRNQGIKESMNLKRKSEIRSTKFEINSKFKIQNSKRQNSKQISQQKTEKSFDVVYLGGHTDIRNYTEKENRELIANIKSSRANVLFVAYGAPFQELWIADHLGELASVRIAMGVGGAYDFVSKRAKRAPKFMQRWGLEWLFRLLTEPWRWKRQLRLVEFWLRVVNEERNKRIKGILA